MKALKIAGITLLALIAIVLILGAIAPKEVKTARMITIHAPIEQVFSMVNDLSTWEKWSPWKETDPEMVITMGEKSTGVGASYTWKGDASGSGKMTILESEPSKRLLIDVAFDGMGEAKAPWTFDSSPEGTQVSWGIDSKMSYPMNAMLLFMDMAESFGRDFEKGLANLKTVIENENRSKTPLQTIMEQDLPYPYVVGVRQTVRTSDAMTFYQNNVGRVYAALQNKKIAMAGRPCGVFFTWDEAGQSSDMLAGIPVAENVDLGKDFETIALPQGKAVILNYYGDYTHIDRAHNTLDNYVLLKKLTLQAPVIEEYVTDAAQEPDPARRLTKVIYLIKE